MFFVFLSKENPMIDPNVISKILQLCNDRYWKQFQMATGKIVLLNKSTFFPFTIPAFSSWFLPVNIQYGNVFRYGIDNVVLQMKKFDKC